MADKPKFHVKEKFNPYMKYTGLAFQLAGIILFSFWLGRKVDEYFGFKKPYLTLILVMVMFGTYMYKLYIDLSKKQ